MKNIVSSLPGYKIVEYSILLNPHEELRNKIMQVKQHFHDSYKNAFALYIKPQVTLATFTQYEMFEERIVNRLKTIAMGFQPVKVELKDFGNFPSHTIYINITTKLPLQELTKQIRTEAQRLMKMDADNKPHFILDPHITIARKLLPWQFEQGWLEYSHKHFTGRFIADAMLLLKRPAGSLKYEIAGRYEFQNLLVTTKQGELFG